MKPENELEIGNKNMFIRLDPPTNSQSLDILKFAKHCPASDTDVLVYNQKYIVVGVGKERLTKIETRKGSTRFSFTRTLDREDYWPSASRLLAVNAIGTQMRDLISKHETEPMVVNGTTALMDAVAETGRNPPSKDSA